jgi:hypothetical protein
MEEGLETHELVKDGVEHHEHAQKHGKKQVVAGAILAAILAVLAAIATLFSGNSANQAVLAEIQASDEWAYYQAESTKGHLFEANLALLSALEGNKKAKLFAEKFQANIKKYNAKKKDIERQARNFEETSKHEFEAHHHYAVGIACFQVGIVLASIFILVEYNWIYFLAILAGISGMVSLFVGLAG